MDEQTKDIKVPIKAIVEQSMTYNNARYEEDEFNLLRKYFIACLNLGYMTPDDLMTMVNKFSFKIKIIVLNYNNTNKLDYYYINEGVLYINGALKMNNPDVYEITFYKAVTEVVLATDETHVSLSTSICQMIADKVHNMDTNGSRIIMPNLSLYVIGDKKHNLRAGYSNYNLTISLLKELLIGMKLNENVMFKKMYFEGFTNVINELFNTDTSKLLIDVLDKIFILDLNRITRNEYNSSENELIDKYQLIVNGMFKGVDASYLAFCALITTDELREKCMKLNENK